VVTFLVAIEFDNQNIIKTHFVAVFSAKVGEYSQNLFLGDADFGLKIDSSLIG
jgi:hypothetical protein